MVRKIFSPVILEFIVLVSLVALGEDEDILDFHAVTFEEFISFMCSTNGVFAFCSVEFLVNQITTDNFRFHNNTCFHHKRRCEPNECQCDQNCSLFQWNYTKSFVSNTTEFSCLGVIEKSGACHISTAIKTLRVDTKDYTISDIEKSTTCAVKTAGTDPTIITSTDSPVVFDDSMTLKTVIILLSIALALQFIYICYLRCRIIKNSNCQKLERGCGHQMDLASMKLNYRHGGDAAVNINIETKAENRGGESSRSGPLALDTTEPGVEKREEDYLVLETSDLEPVLVQSDLISTSWLRHY